MQSLTLYEIAADYRLAVDQLADLDLPSEVVADTLESLAGDLETKSTNVAMFIRNLEAMAASIKQAEGEMATRRKAIEARAERVRDYLKDNMSACGISKIESPYLRIALRQNPESVIVDANLDTLPDQFVRITVTRAADKTAIKQALQDGAHIEGCHLARSTRLEIK